MSRRAFVLHFLLVTVVPGCLVAGWWQVNRALSGNLLSYFYSIEWPIFAILGVIAWWQLVHDQPLASDFEAPREVRRSWLHRDDEVPSRLSCGRGVREPGAQGLQRLPAGPCGRPGQEDLA